MTHPRSQAGFTIIEVLVAMTVLLVGVFSVIALLDRANAATLTTRDREGATNLARELVEAARSVSYDELSVPIVAKLQGFGGLADDRPSQPGWQVERRGRVYTVTASVCTHDDAGDGHGDHTLSTGFCENATPTTPADRNPEDYKRVTVRAEWTTRTVTRNVTQTVLINNPGSAGGPAITSLVAMGGVDLTRPFDDQSQEVLSFRATTSSIPATVSWRLDGVVQTAPMVRADTAGYQWTINWDLGRVSDADAVEDGTYLLGAEAFNVYGISGPSRSVTVTLNRFRPTTPRGIAGGRSGDPADLSAQRVDLEWLANPERDIIGYAVYRSTSPLIGLDGRLMGAVEVCPLADQLTCADPSPPATIAPLYYVVRAYDRDPVTGQPRSNRTDHLPLAVIPNDRRPAAPLNLRLEKVDGHTVITWDKPPAADPAYVGDGIDFYRVYRDGQAFDSRYTRVDDTADTVTFMDTQTDGTSHRYWVTAVDDNYAESGFSNEAAG